MGMNKHFMLSIIGFMVIAVIATIIMAVSFDLVWLVISGNSMILAGITAILAKLEK